MEGVMHIVMLSDHESLGGAGIAASRLAERLCRNHRVTRPVFFPDGKLHPWRTIVLGRENVVARWTRRVARKLLWPSIPRPGTPEHVEGELRRLLARLRPDVINLHNLHAAGPWGWGPEMATVCADYAPVVWTLHDMWSFTARCTYAYDCRGFERGCRADCPTAAEYPSLEPAQIHDAWQKRRALLESRAELTAVTPSRWLRQEALCGLWRGHRVEAIPNGVPTEIFRPLDRAQARHALGLEPRGLVLLVVAHDLSERRKGADLVAACGLAAKVPGDFVTLLTMGQGMMALHDKRVRLHPLGFVEDDQRKALAYSAADALLHPAPVDNFPNVILEAMACGTPAIGLPVGGVPEMIQPGKTGWLAEAVNPHALGEAVERASADLLAGLDLRTSCRNRAQSTYSVKQQALRYESMFRELISPCQEAGRGLSIVPGVQ